MTEALFQDNEESLIDNSVLHVNRKFAAQFERKKRNQEKINLESQLQDSDESSSESEDEDGECLTENLDMDIQNTVKLIRSKDPSIYDPNVAFFKTEEKTVSHGKKEKKLYYKDVVRREILNGDVEDSEEEEVVETYAEEQEKIRKEFLANSNEMEDKDGVLFEEMEGKDVEGVVDFKQEKDDEKFLKSFLNSKGWISKDAFKVEEDLEEDMEMVEKADQFESEYNFRYEEKNGNLIQTYDRNVQDSIRRKDDTRKRKRLEKKERKAKERAEKENTLKRLKKIKQEEMKEKIDKIVKMRGKEIQEMEMDMDGDFDPEEHDRKMAELFNDDYYNEDDEDMDSKKNVFAKDIEQSLGFEIQPEILSMQTDSSAAVPVDDENLTKEQMDEMKHKYLNELYALDYEDLIGDMPCRFKYRSVAKNDYGLSTSDILDVDDQELKKYVSLKKLAPYVDNEYQVSKKKATHFKYTLKKQVEQMEREQEEKKKRKQARKEKQTTSKIIAEPEAEQDSSTPENLNTEDKVILASTENSTQADDKVQHADAKPAKKKRKRNKSNKNKTAAPMPQVPDSRLASYKLKPLQ